MRLLRVVALGAALAVAALGVTTGSTFAYGKADAPLAQLELSANCTNAGSPYCAPSMFGLGGIWLWIEIDTGGTADVSGAECGHLPGLGCGAGPVKGTVPWWYSSAEDLPAGTIAVGTDPNDLYYATVFGFAFPVTTGHYSLRLDKGVFLQAQVAP
jgi:hypothetical protein